MWESFSILSYMFHYLKYEVSCNHFKYVTKSSKLNEGSSYKAAQREF